MVKKGPCFHCGINSTPLWRNGPAEKPVLCNACGSRYKQRGNLDDYFPKKYAQGNSNSSDLNSSDQSSLANLNLNAVDDVLSDHDDSQKSGGDNEIPDLLTSEIPSKKRSRVVYEEETPIQSFHKQLLRLYRSQPDESSEDDILLMERVNHYIPENETGLGAILLKPPVDDTRADTTSTPKDDGSSSHAPSNN